MANSGYRDEWVTNWDTLRFQWWESEQSIAGNYTIIGWKLELIATNDGRMSSSAAKSWWVNVNGSYYEGTNNVSINNNTTKELASGYTTIYHNSDGTKEFSYSFSQYFGITFSGNRINSVGGSSNGTLTSIPRKATFRSPEAYDFDDETSPTIYFNHPAGSALELQARIMCGDDYITSWIKIDDANAIAAGEYTFPLWAFQSTIWTKTIENKSTYVDVTFELATLIGDHFEYATSSVKRCTLINYLPVLDPTVIDEGSVSTQFTKNPNTMIRDYNVIKASFNDTGDSPRTYARKGASIVGKSVTCGNNVPLFGDGYFEYVHDNTFTFSITDSRGQTVPYSITMPAVYYFYPTCEINHSIDLYPNNIANINVTLSGNVFNNYFGDPNAGAAYNVLHLYYRYYKSSEQAPTEWTEISATDIAYNGNSYSCNNIKIQDVDYKDSYVVEARVTDNIAYHGVNANTQRITITPVFDWGENDFNFNVPVNFSDGASIQNSMIMDFVVEQGETSDGWHYRKWNNGTAECWRNKTFTFRATLGWGYGYVACTTDGTMTAPIEQTLPTGLFTRVDDAQITLYKPGYLIVAMGQWFDATSVKCYVWLPTGPYDSLEVWNSCRVIGKWK